MKHLWHMTLTIRPNQQHNHTPNPHATIGDCPDAAYFGPNVHADRDEVEMLTLKDDSGEGGEGRGERGGEGCEGWLGGEGERERGGYEGILCYNFTFKLYQIPSNVGITLILNHTSTLTLALTPTQSPNPQPSTIALTPTQNPNPQPSNPKPQPSTHLPELHMVTMVNHRALKTATYGSIAILKPSPGDAATLSKTHMAGGLGIKQTTCLNFTHNLLNGFTTIPSP